MGKKSSMKRRQTNQSSQAPPREKKLKTSVPVPEPLVIKRGSQAWVQDAETSLDSWRLEAHLNAELAQVWGRRKKKQPRPSEEEGEGEEEEE